MLYFRLKLYHVTLNHLIKKAYDNHYSLDKKRVRPLENLGVKGRRLEMVKAALECIENKVKINQIFQEIFKLKDGLRRGNPQNVSK